MDISIPVTSTDGGFGYRKFYGRISREGVFVPGRDATAEALPAGEEATHA